jgi:hypothetical protein
LTASIEYLQAIIEPVAADLYSIYEKDARHRLSGRDELDWPVLATALALACPIWTEDTDFFGIGVAVWTTNHIEIFLRAHSASKQDE